MSAVLPVVEPFEVRALRPGERRELRRVSAPVSASPRLCGEPLAAPAKKGIWVVINGDNKPIAVMLTGGLSVQQRAVASGITLAAAGDFSVSMAEAWRSHGVVKVFATAETIRFWEKLQAVSPMPFPKAVWMAME